MPILQTVFKVVGRTPDGKQVELPPAVGLPQKGPLIQVTVQPQHGIAQAQAAQGKASTTSKSGFALIDTGASNTCIDEKLAKDLQLPVIDVGFMMSASHAKTPCQIYPVNLILHAPPNLLHFQSIRACGAALKGHGVDILIGRDILSACIFFYNGPRGEIALAL
jgi:hypothetical protein